MAAETAGAKQSLEPAPQKKWTALIFLADRLTGLLRFARYVYLARVPIAIGLVLLGFPFAALLQRSPLRALFQNLFYMERPGIWQWPTFFSTMAALALAWSVQLTYRVVMLNCSDRFNVPSRMTTADLRGWHFFGVLLLALPAIFGQFTQNGDFRPDGGICWPCIAAVAMAAICSYLLAFIALWIAVVLAPPNTQGSALTFPCPPFMKDWLRWADDHHVLPKGFTPGLWARENLPCGLWRGYLASDGFMWSGHWLALLFGIATLALYGFIGWWHGTRSLGQVSDVTALTFVLLLLLNANWVLSYAAFFLDRFRIPVLIPLALFALVSGNTRSSDHYFRVHDIKTGIAAPSPGEVLRGRAGKPIVLIATAGGGIQAAAWTAQVMTGLQQQYELWKPGQSFADNVALISSVSGGATGSMFYMDLFHNSEPHFQRRPLDNLTDLVSQSSLDDIAWALVYKDLPSIFLPLGNRIKDRGYALEENWGARAHLSSSLADWREGVKEGWRPAVIFNSTITETGEPLALSTTPLGEDLNPHTRLPITPRRRYFYDKDLYLGHDVRVTTAVRMAATFPYVTPAARPDTPDKDGYHMIDGGYYDNYGVSNLIAWLDQGLDELQKECNVGKPNTRARQTCLQNALPRILVLQIRSFPPNEEAQPKKKGWAFQLYAPVEGLLSVRDAAQLVRDRDALDLFAHRWEDAQAELAGSKIQFATFEFGGPIFAARGTQENQTAQNQAVATADHRDKAKSPPLSWAMNPSQVQAVKDDWAIRINPKAPEENDQNVEKVHCFFDIKFNYKLCESLPHRPE